MNATNATNSTNAMDPMDPMDPTGAVGSAGPVLRYPDVLLDYACKCGSCRRTCCTRRDWEISMSLAERDAALTWANGAGRTGSPASEADARLAGLAGPVDPADLADLLAGMEPCGDGRLAMPAKADGTCALLDGGGRCAWRACRGDDLCAVCREFPVMYLRLFGDVYAYPSGACEAVLEALLRKRGRVEMRERALGPEEAAAPRAYLLDVADRPDVSGEVGTADAADAAGVSAAARAPYGNRNLRDTVYGHYPAFVRLGLDVLQDGPLPLDARVATLVTCLDVAAKMDRIGQCPRVEAALGSMLSGGRDRALADGIARAARRPSPAVRVCSELFFCCTDDPDGSYAPMARRVLDGLGFTAFSRNPNPAVKGKLRLTDEGRLERGRERGRAVLGERADFLSKVMACVYLHNGVPLANPDPWSNARFFALCYALVKFGIAGYFNVAGGIAGEPPPEPGDGLPGDGNPPEDALPEDALPGNDLPEDALPGDEELVDFLVVVLRAFIHNGGFYRNALRLMDDLKLTEVEDIVCMVQW